MLRSGEIDPSEYILTSQKKSNLPTILKEAVRRGIQRFGIGCYAWMKIRLLYRKLFKDHQTDPAVSGIAFVPFDVYSSFLNQ
jgi:hypothetical protein